MSGSILGPDQVRKINAAFPALVGHVRSLLIADHTGVGLMRVHAQVESFDSDEMARIFRELSFISPVEKKALVRAAIYELLAKEPVLFVAPEVPAMPVASQSKTTDTTVAPKTFTPPQFNLNVNKAEDFHGKKPADTPAPEPIVTSTHTPKVAEQLKAGVAEQKVQNDKVQAAVAKLRESSSPKKVIEIPVVPADAVVPAVEETFPGQSQE